MPSDIIDESTDSNSRRKKKKNSKLSRKRVKDDALPCIWPDLPEHLTKVVTPRPTSLSSSESRQGNAKRLLEEAEQDRITRDTFHSLSELISKEGQLLLPPNVCKVVSDNYIIFYQLDFNDDVPKMRYSVQVLSDLSFILCFENEKIPNSHVNSINKESMNTCTTLNTIFNYRDSIPKKQVSDEEIIDDIIQKLKDSRFLENKKISFLVE